MWDHPRGCGEHILLAHYQPPISWIIPADAGSTGPRGSCGGCPGDHPRGCGEHKERNSSRLSRMGSSPRMRGAHLSISPLNALAGIIPADAGSTRKREDFIRQPEDHPRGCGEHGMRTVKETVDRGSSPRMRGAPVRHQTDDDVLGIIPADAGSTWRWAPARSSRKDHPRGCGEHPRGAGPSALPWGSSPRMRGARIIETSNPQTIGIIPADAGSTACLACPGR